MSVTLSVLPIAPQATASSPAAPTPAAPSVPAPLFINLMLDVFADDSDARADAHRESGETGESGKSGETGETAPIDAPAATLPGATRPVQATTLPAELFGAPAAAPAATAPSLAGLLPGVDVHDGLPPAEARRGESGKTGETVPADPVAARLAAVAPAGRTMPQVTAAPAARGVTPAQQTPGPAPVAAATPGDDAPATAQRLPASSSLSAPERFGAELAASPAREPVATAASPSATAQPAPAGHQAAVASPAAAPAPDSGAAPESGTLKLPNGAATQWRQPLLQALGERLQVEIGRSGERAVIRLDPPMMGSVEIVIRHEGGSLQVHLSASHGEVLRQLQSIGESLRQDLVHRQYADVSVLVSDGSHDGGGRQRRGQGGDEERGPGRALVEAGGDQSAFLLGADQE